jgi:hypothetical protein
VGAEDANADVEFLLASAYQDVEIILLAQAAQKGPDARRRAMAE